MREPVTPYPGFTILPWLIHVPISPMAFSQHPFTLHFSIRSPIESAPPVPTPAKVLSCLKHRALWLVQTRHTLLAHTHTPGKLYRLGLGAWGSMGCPDDPPLLLSKRFLDTGVKRLGAMDRKVLVHDVAELFHRRTSGEIGVYCTLHRGYRSYLSGFSAPFVISKLNSSPSTLMA